MSNWKLYSGVAAAIMASAAIVAPAEAQVTTSGVSGSVIDESGAPVANADVIVRDDATGIVRTTTTSSNGQFVLRNLPVGGSYDVSVMATNYQSQEVPGVTLTLGDVSDVDFVLSEGDRTMETVVVTGSSAIAQVATGPSTSFNIETLEQAPTINRNITDVLRIDPRVYVDESRGEINPIQCGGKNPRFNSLTLDGVRLNDGFGLNSNGYPTERQPFPYDAIEQVSVELAPFDVQYGGFTACNINAVTKSGSNEFHGNVFYDYTSDDLQGDSLEGDNITLPSFEEKRYGAQVGGPIIEDKLFFSVAYEKLEGVNTFDRGAQGSGAINEVNITQAELDRIAQIARDVYQYDPGGIPSGFDNEDEKLLVKLDWNINNDHRAAFTYNYNDGYNTVESDGDLSEFEFANHLYERGSELNQYVGFLYSDWTDNFSTELRVGYVDLKNRQDSVGGTDFGEIRVATDDVDVYLGGDDSRQSNVLEYSIFNMALKGFYEYDVHNFTFGYEREEYDIYNLFVQHSETEIRFDGIDNFENGFADAIYYNNAPSGNPQDAAADWGYAINTLYLQDEIDVTDRLSFTIGARYDFWQTDDAPVENPQFVADYGFSNSETLDGRDLFQPRFAFNYDHSDTLSFQGGVGLYSGGDPNVWLSNNYSANNVLQFGQRGRSFGYTDGTRSLFDPGVQYTMCEDGVPSGPGYCVPQELADAVAQGVGDNFEINYLDPDFVIPSEWKFSLGMTWIPTVAAPGILGGEYIVKSDVIVSRGQDSAIILRGDVEQAGTDANGYPIYDSVREPAFVLTNSKVGNESLTASVTVAKQYDFGLDWTLGYAYNDAEDVQPMTSSVAFSNYTNRQFFDPQEQVLSTSNYNTEHRITAFVNYEKAFFGDYNTTLSALGIANSGKPYSIAGVQCCYGDVFVDFGNTQLLQPGTRNAQEGSWWGKVDLTLEQEFPGILADHRSSAFVTIDNFTNLLNDEWGIQRQPDFPGGVAPGAQPEARIGDASRYSVRVGVRYDF
ncbi:TonB-dependent receptor [Henriciella sp.]|uniref:TonB-dependent receptor n=1 Tax=Henriciella sp. TaxID=1968823 RepID=UPI0026395381|nr:TonB-dependent receptor [Henriciella sp.]